MSDKLGLGQEIKEFNLGSSFTNSRGSAFHTFRYDFKPASVDTSKMATVDIFTNNEVNVTVPHCDGAGTAQTSMFRGPKKSYGNKECVLIIDHNTGEITLERLSHNIQLKKTRAEGTTKAGQSLSPAENIQLSQSYAQNRKMSPNRSHKSPPASVSPSTLSPPYRSPQGVKVSPKHNNQGMLSKRSITPPLYNSMHVSSLPGMPILDQMGVEVAVLEEDEAGVGILSDTSSSSDSDSSSDSSASDSDSDIDRTKVQTPVANGQNLLVRSPILSSSVAHLSMPSHLLSEDLRLSDSDGSDSD